MGMMRRQQPTEIENVNNSGEVIQRLGGYLSHYRLLLLGLILVVIASSVAAALGPLLIGQAIDQFIIKGDSAGLGQTMLLLIGTFLIGTIAQGGQFYLMGHIGQRMLASVRQDIFDKIQSLPVSYFDKNEAGDLMSRLVNDVDTLNQFFGQGLVQVVGGVFQMIGIGIAMIVLQWQLGLATMLLLPMMFGTTMLISRRSRIAFRESREVLGDVSSELEEGISSVKVAQAFDRADANVEHFTEVNKQNRNANVTAVGITSTLTPAMTMFNAIATAIVIGLGGFFVMQGAMTVGLVVSFLQYVQQFFRPVQQISQFWGQAQSALAGAERIFELLDEDPAITDKQNALELPMVQGHVRFEDVAFAYDADNIVLRDINLDVEPGQMIALVGETGAGKTTIVNLLARFYDTTQGRILVDDYNIRDVTQASLRSQLGIVLQDNFLFSGTIADNIRYGKREATDTEIEAVCRTIGLDGIIQQMENGYQTEIGERGDTLSLGQRQLISLARALLADPRILILDEATSNIDTQTEIIIQDAMDTLLYGRTSFVIAHRLSTIREADQLLVLENGRIIERGICTATRSAHEDLLAQNGAYARLYARQFRDDTEAVIAQNGHAVMI